MPPRRRQSAFDIFMPPLRLLLRTLIRSDYADIAASARAAHYCHISRY
jgi:hypothetical protein